jgi:hypothetical protein
MNNGGNEMKQWTGLIFLATFLMAAAVACLPDRVETPELRVEGPALIMFYTDG